MPDSIFDENINAIKDLYPDVVAFLEGQISDNDYIPEELDVSVGVQDVSGRKVMCAEKEGRTYQLDSLYDSDALLDIWIGSFSDEWEFEAKLLMYGLGNGMFARKFLQSAREDCSILIYEPSVKMLKVALENFDLTDILPNRRVTLIFWPVLKKQEEIRLFYNHILDYKDIKTIKTTFYTNYPRLFKNDCVDYVAGINDAMEYVLANQVVHDRFGGYYSRNLFNNLKYIPDSLSYADLIEKMPEDVPAIIVAAGPSLDKNIKELEKAKGRSLIISTDTALRPLAMAGIEPDLTAIMDGKKDARYLSEEASRIVPLFCTPKSGDTFMNLHKGVKFFTDDGCANIKAFMDKEGCMFSPLSTGGSVANACFGLAMRLGCKRIILVGQDLAYTGDKTHSGVTVRGEKKTAVEDLEHAYMGIDIDGNPIRTSLEFRTYKQLFENEIKTHPDIRVIDATEGGIMIEGTELMTLKKAIEQECNREFEFDVVLKQVGKLLPGDKEKRFIDLMIKIPGQMKELEHLINVSKADYVSMKKLVKADNYHSSKFKSLYKETQTISKRIEANPVMEYVQDQLQGRSSQMLDKVNRLEQDEKRDLLAVCDLGEKYLTDMLDALSELEPYVEKMKNDILSEGT